MPRWRCGTSTLRSWAKRSAALSALGAVSGATVELTDEASVGAAAPPRWTAHQRIDILVNNAGITGGNGTTWELDPQVWRRVIDVNLIGPYLTCRARRAADDRSGYGRIVNIASVAGKEGNPNASHYSASKAGADRADQVARQGTGDQGRAGQRGHAGGGEDGDVRRR